MLSKLKKIAKNSRTAFDSKINSIKKDKVLKKFANLLLKNKQQILKENLKDIKFANKKNIKENLIKRLELNGEKINSIVKSVNQIIKIKDDVLQNKREHVK